VRWETENRAEKLWVPQGTDAQKETEKYEAYFDGTVRFNNMLVQSATDGGNVLEKESLVDAIKMHTAIESTVSTTEGKNYTLLDLCAKAGGSCVSGFDGVCQCFVQSILRQWNYNLDTLQNDEDVLATLNSYGSREDLEALLGNPVFNEDDQLVSAEAFTLSYFLEERSMVENGEEVDPINERWEKVAFLDVAEAVETDYPLIRVDYFAFRSFADEFGEAITGDLGLVQISYVMAFLFLGATLGNIRCGAGSRWSMALAALVTVGISTAAGFGISAAVGLFYGPVHSLLPFILLGIGVDDAFVIVNAFNRERKASRLSEDNDSLGKRAGRALARAGASITVTSMTDLVAFGISASSAIPALGSFCGYAAICIVFLWLFASTFFSATLVLDERRQRDNRRECLCCLARKKPIVADDDDAYQEDYTSKYFRNYHAPIILSRAGKVVVLAVFAAMFGYGVYGAINLPVEDTERAFIPQGSYLENYFDANDRYFPSQGINVFITFEDSSDIFEHRQELSELNERVSGLESQPPYFAEPNSEKTYRNVMSGLRSYIAAEGTAAIGGASIGRDGWPTTEEDFVDTLLAYASVTGPGAVYAQDVSFTDDESALEAFRVQLQYVRLTKTNRGEVIDDADKQIDAMDATRDLVASWDDLPEAFPYSEKFITIEGFKIIRRELLLNVGLAILAVAIIVLLTVASPVTALLITLSVGCCIVEILGFMFALGIVIDTVSVINIVLAVGLSVDYSAHVGHCFMVKGGEDKNKRALEALADVGAAVLNGATSTFLAVIVLLFSSSYVFVTLSRQFALTVALGISHGLILLPVLLSLLGPKAFESAHDDEHQAVKDNGMATTGHASANENSSDEEHNNPDDSN